MSDEEHALWRPHYAVCASSCYILLGSYILLFTLLWYAHIPCSCFFLIWSKIIVEIYDVISFLFRKDTDCKMPCNGLKYEWSKSCGHHEEEKGMRREEILDEMRIQVLYFFRKVVYTKFKFGKYCCRLEVGNHANIRVKKTLIFACYSRLLTSCRCCLLSNEMRWWLWSGKWKWRILSYFEILL
jgi:hypothetical protein